MRTDSFVYTTVQKPMTIIGFPPALSLIIIVLLLLIGFPLIFIIGFLWASLIMAFVAVGVFLFVWLKTRNNCHFEMDVFVSLEWIGRKHRSYRAGRNPNPKPTKKDKRK